MLYGYPDDTGRLWEVHNDMTVEDSPEGAYALTQDQFDNRFDWIVDGGALVHSPAPVGEHPEEQEPAE